MRSLVEIVEIFRTVGVDEARLRPDVLRLLFECLSRHESRSTPEGQPMPVDSPRPPMAAPISGTVFSKRTIAVLAVVTTGCAAAALAMWWSGRPVTYSRTLAEQPPVTLEDGSTVSLNVQSVIEVRFSRTHRRVRLVRGEAFFNVTRQASRPFEVTSGDAEVRVLGTQFNLCQRSGQARVAVIEGLVSVQAAPGQSPEHPPESPPEAPLTLGPGEAASIRGSEITKEPQPDLKTLLAWRKGYVVADDEPLADIAAELNLHNVRQLRISGNSIARKRISANVQANHPETFVAFLGLDPELSVRDVSDGWIVEPRQATGNSPRNRRPHTTPSPRSNQH
jgi:transmembrane sensor